MRDILFTHYHHHPARASAPDGINESKCWKHLASQYLFLFLSILGDFKY